MKRAEIIKIKITKEEILVNILPNMPLEKPDISIPSPAPTSINGIMVAELEANPIAVKPSAGNGNFWLPYRMNDNPSKTLNTSGPRNVNPSKNLLSNKSNLYMSILSLKQSSINITCRQ